MSAAIAQAKTFSEARLGALRAALRDLVPDGAAVFTFGSYARREASRHSDLDYVVVTDGAVPADAARALAEAVERAIAAVVPIAPSTDGAFADVVGVSDFVTLLGGRREDNARLTRRMLLLLEGEWLAGEASFRAVRRRLLALYTASARKDGQLALFLLNDVIRYWRTMTVDYRFKTVEAEVPKKWAIRNIKLVFSRKLMYAGGLFAVGLTADRAPEEQAALLESLFDLPVLDRMDTIVGPDAFAEARAHYDAFLDALARDEVRAALQAVPPGDYDEPVFRDLKARGHEFNRCLLAAFARTFAPSHPIHAAVLF